MFPSWDWTMVGITASLHMLAILSTAFRLWYRRITARIWWEDGWAGVALVADIACLTVALLEQPIPDSPIPQNFWTGNLLLTLAYPTILWTSRISILISIVRASHPEGMLKRIALCIGVLFAIMGVAMLCQRIQICFAVGMCVISRAVIISQATTDGVADVLLTGLPIWFLRDVRLHRKRKILIFSAFSASMVVNVLTTAQAIVLFQPGSSGSVLLGHIKAAFTLIVCNMLVIVTFVYRIMHTGESGLDDFAAAPTEVEFTTVDLAQAGLSQEISKGFPSHVSASTKSSTWSFKGDRRGSKVSTAATAGSRIEIRSVA